MKIVYLRKLFKDGELFGKVKRRNKKEREKREKRERNERKERKNHKYKVAYHHCQNDRIKPTDSSRN